MDEEMKGFRKICNYSRNFRVGAKFGKLFRGFWVSEIFEMGDKRDSRVKNTMLLHCKFDAVIHK